MMTVQQAFDLALQHHQAGRLAEAEALYQQILAVQPQHAEALHFLGVAFHQMGHSNIAAECIERALAIAPDNVTAHANLGEICRCLGRLEEAMGSLRRAIEIDPGDAPAHYNLANALRDHGCPDEAVSEFRTALRLDPNYAEAHNNLGNLLRNKGLIDEAISEYRQALAVRPDYTEACNNLGTALRLQRRFEEAASVYGRALEIQPQSAETYNNLGIAYAESGCPDAAVSAYQRALAIRPEFALAHNNLGNVLKEQGRLAAAVDEFREAMRLQPDDPVPHSNLIYTLHFLPEQTAASIAEEKARWASRLAEPLRQFIRPHPNERNAGRRLRIGYLSPDFRAHVVGRNILPLLQFRDPGPFDVFCYSDVRRSDEMTERIRAQADSWRPVAGISDEALVEMIRQDGIDILVDLTQHMGNNRLTVFALQPAPVQVSFAGYPETTGLNTIAYRISDRYLETEKVSDQQAAERLFLIDSFWCYDPCGIQLEVNELPAKQSDWLTFGSLNHFSKVNPPLLELWAQVLRKIADSRLILLSQKGSHREQTLDFLERQGVARQRIEFVEPRPRRDYLELYHRLDMMLDTFPYNGHTTSLDALWMGVPVVSLAGERAVSRAGLSQLTNLGLPEWVAFTADDYVKIAGQWAHDLPRLMELRCTLRQRMEASVLMDARRFASQIENAYRAMWREWCAQEAGK